MQCTAPAHTHLGLCRRDLRHVQPRHVQAYHVCKYNDERRSELFRVIKTLAFQLATADTELGHRLARGECKACTPLGGVTLGFTVLVTFRVPNTERRRGCG